MICPTDCLEPVIESRFKGSKFFLTSLGNASVFDEDLLIQIAAIVEKRGIKEITFVLSENNSIICDAINNQNYIEIRGLNKAYNHLLKHKKEALSFMETYNQHTIILSYHLNEKIKELKSGLRHHLQNLPEINGKLFSKSYNSFRQIYSELACINSIILS